jgi:hypothetical protein
MRFVLRSSLGAIIFVLVGCATTYKPIHPPTLNYSPQVFTEGIGVSYVYEVLRDSRNKKYARQEARKGYKLVAVKITNGTTAPLILSENAKFFSGTKEVFPMSPQAFSGAVRQQEIKFLWYILLNFVSFEDGNKSIPVGLVLAPLLGAGNVWFAYSANNKMRKELEDYNLLDREIQQGETVHGLIGLYTREYGPISIEVKAPKERKRNRSKTDRSPTE